MIYTDLDTIGSFNFTLLNTLTQIGKVIEFRNEDRGYWIKML